MLKHFPAGLIVIKIQFVNLWVFLWSWRIWEELFACRPSDDWCMWDSKHHLSAFSQAKFSNLREKWRWFCLCYAFMQKLCEEIFKAVRTFRSLLPVLDLPRENNNESHDLLQLHVVPFSYPIALYIADESSILTSLHRNEPIIHWHHYWAENLSCTCALGKSWHDIKTAASSVAFHLKW